MESAMVKYQNLVQWKMEETEALREAAAMVGEATQAAIFIRRNTKFMPRYKENNHHFHHLVVVALEELVRVAQRDLIHLIDLNYFR